MTKKYLIQDARTQWYLTYDDGYTSNAKDAQIFISESAAESVIVAKNIIYATIIPIYM